MVNYQLCYLMKYHGLNNLVDPIDNTELKNSNIHYSKKQRNKVNTYIRYVNRMKRTARDIKSQTYLEVRNKQKSRMTKDQVSIGHEFKENP